jgi:hypothetical protein
LYVFWTLRHGTVSKIKFRGGLGSKDLCDHPNKKIQKARYWHFVWEIVKAPMSHCSCQGWIWTKNLEGVKKIKKKLADFFFYTLHISELSFQILHVYLKKIHHHILYVFSANLVFFPTVKCENKFHESVLIQHANFIFNQTHSCRINRRVVKWK